MRWYTSRFNEKFRWFASRYRVAIGIWFSIGVWSSIAVFPLAVYLLLTTVYYQLTTFIGIFADSAKIQSNPLAVNIVESTKFGRFNDEKTIWTLQSVIPGINRPLLELPVYLAALLLASIVHELGHALAACRERVTVYVYGVTTIAYILPVAYVEIDFNQLQTLAQPIARLRILCAGVWHNMAAALVLSLAATMGFSNRTTEGVVVRGVRLDGLSGFRLGDVITDVDGCVVSSRHTWLQCVRTLAQNPPLGFCVTQSFVDANNSINYNNSLEYRQNNESNNSDDIECCPVNLSASHVCFWAINVYNKSGHDQQKEQGQQQRHQQQQQQRQQHHEKRFYCMPARAVLVSVVSRCHVSSAITVCHDSGNICLHPSLSQSTDRLLLIRRSPTSGVHSRVSDDDNDDGDDTLKSSSQASSLSAGKADQSGKNEQSYTHKVNEEDLHRPVVFYGSIQTLYHSLLIDDSYLLEPTTTTKLLTYMAQMFSTFAAVSAALVVINLVPTVGSIPLDGHWIWLATIEWLCAVFVVSRRRCVRFDVSVLSRFVCCAGTVLLAVCLVFNFVIILVTYTRH